MKFLRRISCLLVLPLLVTQALGVQPVDVAETRVEGAKRGQFVELEMHRILENGARQTVQLLRPASWATSLGLREGSYFDFEATERTFDGRFLIDRLASVDGTRRREHDEGARMVTGTFKTEQARTYTLTLADGTSVRGTSDHPLFSLERNDWVGLGELLPGETLRTADGSVSVSSVLAHADEETVFNIEVDEVHQYLVTDSKLLSHNVWGCLPARATPATPEKRASAARAKARKVSEDLRKARDEAGAPDITRNDPVKRLHRQVTYDWYKRHPPVELDDGKIKLGPLVEHTHRVPAPSPERRQLNRRIRHARKSLAEDDRKLDKLLQLHRNPEVADVVSLQRSMERKRAEIERLELKHRDVLRRDQPSR